MKNKGEQSEDMSGFADKDQLKQTLFSSPEGRVLLTGAGLAFLYSFWLGVRLLLAPEESQVLIGMTATAIMFGRAAAMAFGYSLGLKHTTVIPVCMVVETILVLLVDPLFVFSWRRLLVLRWLRTMFDRMIESAEAHMEVVRKYGILGLFVFVWFPFWMTGPVIGCVIGFLIGLKMRVTLAVVLGGTYIAILVWGFLLMEFHDKAASFSSYAAMTLMMMLVVIIIIGHFLQKTIRNNKRKR